MDVALSVLVALFFAAAVYLLLARSVIRMLLGVVVLGNGVNLLIFALGRPAGSTPPIIPWDSYLPLEGAANPLPQALILTAIVIGFALFAFLLVLGYRAYRELDADDTGTMRVAEPEDSPRPPLSY